MRLTLALLALLAAPALAQEAETDKEPKDGADVFRGKTRKVKGPQGRVVITVPVAWKDAEIAGNMVIRAIAPGPYGGHDLRVEREIGQDDVDKQRERYLQHDGANNPGATILKIDKPFYGYRVNTEGKRVMCRAFVTDGSDGIVITVASRYQYFDSHWAQQVYAVIASIAFEGKTGGAGGEDEGLRRLYDKHARVSMVLPSKWKPLKPEHVDDLMFVVFKGTKGGPEFVVHDWGPRLNAGLTLLKISGQWKRQYGEVALTRLGNDPPRLMAQNRKAGHVDYITAFESGGHGFTLMLTVRQGSFERFRPLADEVARSLVFSGGAWAEPAPGQWPVRHEFKKSAVVHAAVEQTASVDAVVKAIAAFEKYWGKTGAGTPRKGAPLHVVVSGEDNFGEASHHFGTRPATYDRVSHAVVVAPRPEDKVQEAIWRGRLFWALTEAALHRDLPVAAPVWLRAGLAACMETAGRTGGSPQDAHPAYVDRLVNLAGTDSHKPLADILKMTESDLYFADQPDMRAQAWGYMHLMLYGKSSLGSMYRRWARALEKEKEKEAPEFAPKYDRAAEDLKKHVYKHWEKK